MSMAFGNLGGEVFDRLMSFGIMLGGHFRCQCLTLVGGGSHQKGSDIFQIQDITLGCRCQYTASPADSDPWCAWTGKKTAETCTVTLSTCEAGYDGSALYTCGSDASFTGTLPTCTAIPCTTPFTPSLGTDYVVTDCAGPSPRDEKHAS